MLQAGGPPPPTAKRQRAAYDAAAAAVAAAGAGSRRKDRGGHEAGRAPLQCLCQLSVEPPALKASRDVPGARDHVKLCYLALGAVQVLMPWLCTTFKTCCDSNNPCLAQVLHLADEKVNLASKIYDYVDQRIRRLDLDMAAFDEELARDRAKLGVMVRRPAAPSLAHRVLLLVVMHRGSVATVDVCLDSLCLEHVKQRSGLMLCAQKPSQLHACQQQHTLPRCSACL